jgi:hypothetical protein
MKRHLLLIPVLAACSTSLQPQPVSRDLARTFAGLYAQQQTDDGRTDVRVTDVHATCGRTGTSHDGPGEDWACTVQYTDAGVGFTQTFELQVKPDGCWKAEAPPIAQPAVRVDPVTGATRTNPLAEFDGCLDTSWG